MSKSMPPAISNKSFVTHWSLGRRSTPAQMDSPSNQDWAPIRPTRQSPPAKSCFPAFGARMFGSPSRRISTRCGPPWKKKSRLLDTLQWGSDNGVDSCLGRNYGGTVSDHRRQFSQATTLKYCSPRWQF